MQAKICQREKGQELSDLNFKGSNSVTYIYIYKLVL